jgi:branched-chain amino acid transport system permease protein
LLGVVALRISGLYLALVTLVFGLTLQSSLFQLPALTNSGAGQPANRPDQLGTQGHFYFACLAVLVIVLYTDVMLMRTKAGRALLTIKADERVAAANGISVVGYKLLGFVLSGIVAGFGGALLAFASQQFNGNDYDFLLGLTFVLMTVVGGAGSREGVVIASVFFALLTRYLPDAGWFRSVVEHVPGQIGTNIEQFGPVAFGALLLLLTLTLNPGGIAQQIAPVTGWFKGEPFRLRSERPRGTPIEEKVHVGA